MTPEGAPYGGLVLPGGEVTVRWAHLDDLTEAHLDLLDQRERERWARLLRIDDRRRFAVGSTLVRSLVAELDDADPREVSLDRTCPRCGAQHGPVATPGRAWHLSVSHSGPFAVVAVVAAASSTTVGVDIETRCPPDWPDLLPDVMAPGEATPRDAEDFLTLWVRKEAVLKATREGLSRPMSSVRVSSARDSPSVVAGAPALRLVDLDVGSLRELGDAGSASGELAAALAVGGEGLTVSWQRARI